MKPIEAVPTHLKLTMSIEEAAAYTGIGINKIQSLLNIPNCKFVLFIGKKRLVKRREFEEFISKALVI